MILILLTTYWENVEKINAEEEAMSLIEQVKMRNMEVIVILLEVFDEGCSVTFGTRTTIEDIASKYKDNATPQHPYTFCDTLRTARKVLLKDRVKV